MGDIVFDNLVFDRLREIGDQSQRIGELEAEIARLRLTDAEREVVAFAVGEFQSQADEYGCQANTEWAETLRGFLARTKSDQDNYTQTNYWAAQRHAAEQKQK